MSDLGKERFESYLKSFRPLQAEPLPATEAIKATFSFPLRWIAAAAMCGLVLAAGIRDWDVTNGRENIPVIPATQAKNPAPLTVGSANALLTQADSLKAGLDEVAWRSRRAPLGPGQQSALGILGKEKL